MPPKSVAIVQTAFIGDAVLATPLFEAARRACPGSIVVGVVRKGCESLLGNNPFVDEIVVWDKHGSDRGIGGILRIARRLRALEVGVALLPHRSFRAALALKLAGVKIRIGFAKGGGSLLHTVRVPYTHGIHEVERNLMLASAAGWPAEGLQPALFPDERDREVVDGIASGIGDYCVLASGSVWATKMWPAEYYAEVGAALTRRGLAVVLSGGMDDVGLCEAIASEIPGAVTTCGLLTLRQSAELYRRASFVLTGDTAPQHIAAASGTFVVAIFGPTARDFGFWPYTERSVVVEEALECRPCGIHGHGVCPKGHHRCMRAVTPGRILGIVDNLLHSAR